MFFSKNPADSYRIIKKISTPNLEPPPIYVDNRGRQFEYFDDSIVFKKVGELNLMYIKDNNLGKVKGEKYYYDDEFRIKRIVENWLETKIV
ncbi:hypothetical protein, partial [Riemerella anatipestifer]